MRGLAATLLVLVASGFLAPVDNWAHFGGLCCGVVLGCAVFRSELVSSSWKRYLAQSVALVGLAVTVLFAVLLFTLQRQDLQIASMCAAGDDAAGGRR